jgi:hypothetical protein
MMTMMTKPTKFILKINKDKHGIRVVVKFNILNKTNYLQMQ